MKLSLAKQRSAKGLCPRCGEEAAPYSLCSKHRLEARIHRYLKRSVKVKCVEQIGTGRHARYRIPEGWEGRFDAVRWQTINYETDRRFLPRIARVPVEIENAIVAAMVSIGRPCTIEEILEAWAKLKSKGRAGTIEGNILYIIQSKDKRAEKLARRARAARASA